MSRKIILIPCVLFSLSTSSWALNLDYYRNNFIFKKNAKTLEKLSSDRVVGFRKKLSTFSYKIPELNIPHTAGENYKVASSSGYVKNIMSKAILTLLNDDKFGMPEIIDPSLNSIEFRALIDQNRKRKFLSILNNTDRAKKSIDKPRSGIYVFLKSYERSLIRKENQAELGIRPIKRPLLIKIIKQVNKYFDEKSPVNKQGKSILDILGKVKDLKISDGKIEKIVFTNLSMPIDKLRKLDNKNKTTLQLNMLLTYRLGEDNYFIYIQDTLIDYLKKQNQIFEKYLENSSVFGLLDSTLKDIVTSFNVKKEELKEAAIHLSDNRLLALADENFDQFLKLKEEFSYQRVMKFYLEGSNSDSESKLSEMINERILLNQSILPFLERKNTSAVEINKKMKNLSLEQVNFALDFFFQERGNDLVSDFESSKIDQIFSEHLQKLGTKITQRKELLEKRSLKLNSDFSLNSMLLRYRKIKNDFHYYKIQSELLYRLDDTLRFEMAREIQKRSDQEKIKEQSRGV